MSFIFEEWDGGEVEGPHDFGQPKPNQFINRAPLDICATFKDEEIPLGHS